ncbi:MAG: FISUMP domain-containing protein [Paludibacter sp.]
MKKKFYFFAFCFVFNLFSGCKNEVSVELPIITTTKVTSITTTTATSGGNIISDGGSSLLSHGVCWSTKANPTINDSKTTDNNGVGLFSSLITGLKDGTTYFVRAYATNISGTKYGNELQFNTLSVFNSKLTYGSVSDIDDNVYKTIKIGTQTWIAENLRTTKYNDGTSIPLVEGSNEWVSLNHGGYCWCNNDISSKNNYYGAWYNWYAVNTGKLAPIGWHVATNSDWSTLKSYISANL